MHLPQQIEVHPAAPTISMVTLYPFYMQRMYPVFVIGQEGEDFPRPEVPTGPAEWRVPILVFYRFISARIE